MFIAQITSNNPFDNAHWKASTKYLHRDTRWWTSEAEDAARFGSQEEAEIAIRARNGRSTFTLVRMVAA